MKKALVVLLSLALMASVGYAQKGSSSGGSRSSSSSGSSRSSSGSSFGGSRTSSAPSTRPSASAPSTRPSAAANTAPSTRPGVNTAPSTRPNATANTTPSTRPGVDANKPISSGTGSNTSPTGPPKSGFKSGIDTTATGAKAKAESKVVFDTTKAPKASYTTSTGKTVQIDQKAASVTTIRQSMTPEKYQNRTVRVENHYHNYYGPRYDYYRSQPYVYVGGGYSPLFWYAMMDWSIDRQAMWYYHNHSTIDQQLYQQQLANNAVLRAKVAELESQKLARNPRYVDPEFKENPDVMYDDSYVEASVNPTIVPISTQPTVIAARPVQSSGAGWTIFYVLLGLVVVAVLVKLVLFTDWDRIFNR